MRLKEHQNFIQRIELLVRRVQERFQFQLIFFQYIQTI